jgi:hypothetical protein
MLVLGTLAVPSGAWARYLAMKVEPSRRADWVGKLSARVRSSARVRTVGASCEAIRGGLREGSWVDVSIEPGARALAVRGVMGEDDFVDHGAELAEMFRVSADVGASGELAFIEDKALPTAERCVEQCYVVEVSRGASSVGHMPLERQRAILRSDAFQRLACSVLESLGDADAKVVIPVERYAPAAHAGHAGHAAHVAHMDRVFALAKRLAT